MIGLGSDKNTIRDGRSTALQPTFTVDTVFTVYTVSTIYTVDTVDMFYTVDTVYAIETALREGQNDIGMCWGAMSKICEWMGDYIPLRLL